MINDYQERVLMAAINLSREAKGEREYHFRYQGENLILTPWYNIPGRGMTLLKTLRVTKDRILGKDPDIVRDLESEVEKLGAIID